MNKTNKSPNAIRIVKNNPNLLDQLKANNDALEDI
jgi:dynein heavy chain